MAMMLISSVVRASDVVRDNGGEWQVSESARRRSAPSMPAHRRFQPDCYQTSFSGALRSPP
jgi:hypothetical protein